MNSAYGIHSTESHRWLIKTGHTLLISFLSLPRLWNNTMCRGCVTATAVCFFLVCDVYLTHSAFTIFFLFTSLRVFLSLLANRNTGVCGECLLHQSIFIQYQQLETAVENVQYKHIKLNGKTLGHKISSVQQLSQFS